jgi:hypothetical protein
LELHVASEQHHVDEKLLKMWERRFHARAALTIVQDEARAAVLGQENRIDPAPFVFVPVAGLGPASYRHSFFLHERCGVPRDKKILLYAGGLFPHGYGVELASVSAHLPPDYAVVMHGFPYDPEWVAAIRRIAPPGRVFLSLDPLAGDQIDDMYASSRIGWAVYRNLGPNFVHIGRSSNKLADLTRCGRPIITSNFPSLQATIGAAGAGVCLADVSDTPAAVEQIERDYAAFSDRALKCFDSIYDARLSFPRLLARLKELTQA